MTPRAPIPSAAIEARPATMLSFLERVRARTGGGDAMLEDLGHAVVEARSGEEALALLRRTRTVDLAIMDYAMPGMTGLQLADAVAAERPGTLCLLGFAQQTGSHNQFHFHLAEESLMTEHTLAPIELTELELSAIGEAANQMMAAAAGAIGVVLGQEIEI